MTMPEAPQQLPRPRRRLFVASSRRLLVAAVASCVGCAYHPPPGPALSPVDWKVDRGALPELTLRVVETGTCSAERHFAVQGGGDERIDMPLWVGVLEHPTEGVILVDAGYGRRTAKDPQDYPGKLAADLFRLKVPPEGPVVERLDEIGHVPEDVRHVLATHMHSDHVGGVEDFPGAALWVARPEWEAAEKKNTNRGYDPVPYANHAVVKTVDFVATPSYGPFQGHVDLFGDRSVVLLPSPGHTPGHMSVLVNLRGGSLLFTGDAAWIEANWRGLNGEGPTAKGAPVRTLLEDDWKRGMDALWRFKAWADAYPDLLLVEGHEASDRQNLKPWPEAYR
jgi:glyoxylase-like metal-dependent hydrolase (beta-lactamase superfamily II)